MAFPVRTVEVADDTAALSRMGAELFVATAAEAIRERERFCVAISGGSTPRPLYGLLATDEFRARIDWERVHFFWADERCVPPDHPDSNFGGARSLLLAKVPLPPANIHRIPGELAPAEAAVAYEEELRRFFAGAPPVFDLILLGLGEDGHTASLFPGGEGMKEEERPALAVYVARLHSHRVSLSLPVLNSARRVAFLVAGRDKAEIVGKVLGGGESPQLPAALVNPPGGILTWLLDSGAAGKLSGNFRTIGCTTST